MKPTSRLTRVPAACAVAALAFVLVSVFGGSSSLAAATKLPAGALGQPGTIRYCSDISSPPLEFYKNGTTATGSDIDLGDAIAKAMRLKPVWVNTAFAGIIPALQAGHCDAIMSQLFDKPLAPRGSRLRRLHELQRGRARAAGNPKHVTGHRAACAATRSPRRRAPRSPTS